MRSNRSRASRRNSLPFVLAVIALAAAALAAVGAGTQGEGFDASNFWRAPLASQGKPPTDWSALEQSLSPEDCGQCHADQWQ